MPLWKIYHPAGAFTAEDKKALSRQVTGIYARIPIPRFYVVTIFEEIERDSLFVGGEPHNKFIRFRIDHIARTLPGPIAREWWMRTLDQILAPYVGDKGYDWEISVDETPFDLWSLQGELPPPFESGGGEEVGQGKQGEPLHACRKASCQSCSRSGGRRSPLIG